MKNYVLYTLLYYYVNIYDFLSMFIAQLSEKREKKKMNEKKVEPFVKPLRVIKRNGFNNWRRLDT